MRQLEYFKSASNISQYFSAPNKPKYNILIESIGACSVNLFISDSLNANQDTTERIYNSFFSIVSWQNTFFVLAPAEKWVLSFHDRQQADYICVLSYLDRINAWKMKHILLVVSRQNAYIVFIPLFSTEIDSKFIYR